MLNYFDMFFFEKNSVGFEYITTAHERKNGFEYITTAHEKNKTKQN